jgi:hypothetical protein
MTKRSSRYTISKPNKTLMSCNSIKTLEAQIKKCKKPYLLKESNSKTKLKLKTDDTIKTEKNLVFENTKQKMR